MHSPLCHSSRTNRENLVEPAELKFVKSFVSELKVCMYVKWILLSFYIKASAIEMEIGRSFLELFARRLCLINIYVELIFLSPFEGVE